MTSAASEQAVSAAGRVLADPGQPLGRRYRALFALRSLGGGEAVEWISGAFGDDSELLKHELAYVLGQMGDARAVPALKAVLQDTRGQQPMVRHEAAEALGAIGTDDDSVLDLLKEYSADPALEVAQTCQLAAARLEWLRSGGEKEDDDDEVTDPNPYLSVDPAPAAPRRSVAELRRSLLDRTLPLFARYRAMFALRNLGGREAALALASALEEDGDGGGGSALLRHEVAYVLGQMQHPAAVPALRAALERPGESAMVRHEAAEALGAVGRDECLGVLRRYRGDAERVVRESCEVALDMMEHGEDAEDEFQDEDGAVSVRG